MPSVQWLIRNDCSSRDTRSRGCTANLRHKIANGGSRARIRAHKMVQTHAQRSARDRGYRPTTPMRPEDRGENRRLRPPQLRRNQLAARHGIRRLPHAAVCLGFPLGVRQSPLTSRPLGRKVEFMGPTEALSIGLKGDISNFDFSDDGPGAEFILTRPPRRWPRVRAAPPRPRRGGSRPPPRALQRHPPHPSRVHGWGHLA